MALDEDGVVRAKDFRTEPRGGAKTKRKTGAVVDCYRCIASSDEAKQFMQEFFRWGARSCTCLISKFGLEHAIMLCDAWGFIAQANFEEWVADGMPKKMKFSMVDAMEVQPKKCTDILSMCPDDCVLVQRFKEIASSRPRSL